MTTSMLRQKYIYLQKEHSLPSLSQTAAFETRLNFCLFYRGIRILIILNELRSLFESKGPFQF